VKRETGEALAIRNDALDRYVFKERTGLASDAYVQCLDVSYGKQCTGESSDARGW
jgi:hypothetical protein